MFVFLNGVGIVLKMANAWSIQLLPHIESYFGISSICSFYLYTIGQLVFVIVLLFLFARSKTVSKFEYADIKWATDWVVCYITIIAFVVTLSGGSIPGKEHLPDSFFYWLQLFFTPVEAYLIPVFLLYGRRTIWDAAYGNASFFFFFPSIGLPYLFLHALKRPKNSNIQSIPGRRY